ncbi:MAG: hypothetical protein CFE24_14960 [Flavobacterium sp. BFFFF2]|nr:MAG: hypothetical protein CFE24_14960 [Flavobacterium sp. BFFFF2]
MSDQTTTALFTTASGVLGGVGKAVYTKPLLIAITLPELTTVIIYAAASAAAGYLVKKVLDECSRQISNYFKQSNSKKDE